MTETVRLTLAEATALCEAAYRSAGANEAAARSIASASVDAEASGQPAVGLAHFIDYLDALQSGRIDGMAKPSLPVPRRR